jgi:23S rRNA (cytidine1920-2'-O)/16S rRNA (cytidine1409-2'-O)-methyltransferase
VAKQPKPKSRLLDKLPERSRYVSRGGDKLRGALSALHLSVEEKICMDIGASTGGFTDCLLQAGARSVWALDVGYGLFDFQLRKDPRVHVLERTNVRYFDPATLPERPDLITADVSFISLDKILGKIWDILKPGGEALVLIKPQFEATPREAPKGVVSSETVRQRILEQIRSLSTRVGFEVKAVTDSTLKGRKGNLEAFIYLGKAL